MYDVTKKDETSSENNWPNYFPHVVCILAVFLLLIYSKHLPPINKILHNLLNFREAAAWGQLGDFIGGILNPFISLLTLFIAVRVWRLQKQELIATRNLLSVQKLEQTLFALIDQIRQSLQLFSTLKSWNRSDSGNFFGLAALHQFDEDFKKSSNKYLELGHNYNFLAKAWVETHQCLDAKNFDALALGIKELLLFLKRNCNDDLQRRNYHGICVALLGEKAFDLAYVWGEIQGDLILVSSIEEMRTLQNSVLN